VSVAETARYVQQLTQPYSHTEPYWTLGRRTQIPRAHRSNHPSLLNQLRAACEPGLVDDTGARIGESKPPVAMSALDVLLRIEAASADWVSRQLEHPLRDTAEANLSLLAGKTNDVRALGLSEAIESWWRWARVESAWDGRPRDLRDPCPWCAQRMLRVAWDVSAAWCRECGSAWGAADVGVLGAMLDQQRASA
jgi:hypothetical protein